MPAKEYNPDRKRWYEAHADQSQFEYGVAQVRALRGKPDRLWIRAGLTPMRQLRRPAKTCPHCGEPYCGRVYRSNGRDGYDHSPYGTFDGPICWDEEAA